MKKPAKKDSFTRRDARMWRILSVREDIIPYSLTNPLPGQKFALPQALRGCSFSEKRRYYDWFGYHRSCGHDGFELVPSDDDGMGVAIVDARLFLEYASGARRSSSFQRRKNSDACIASLLEWPLIDRYVSPDSVKDDLVYLVRQVARDAPSYGDKLASYYYSHQTKPGFVRLELEDSGYVFPALIGYELLACFSNTRRPRANRSVQKPVLNRAALESYETMIREGVGVRRYSFLYPPTFRRHIRI